MKFLEKLFFAEFRHRGTVGVTILSVTNGSARSSKLHPLAEPGERESSKSSPQRGWQLPGDRRWKSINLHGGAKSSARVLSRWRDDGHDFTISYRILLQIYIYIYKSVYTYICFAQAKKK